jgi:hypothetical protein
MDSIVEVRSGIALGGTMAAAKGVESESIGWYVGCVKAVVDGSCTDDMAGFERLRKPWDVALNSPEYYFASNGIVQLEENGFSEPVAAFDSWEYLDVLGVPLTTYTQVSDYLVGYRNSNGPTKFASTASSHFKRRSTVMIERVVSNISYDDLITVAVDLVSTDAVKGDKSIHDDCGASDAGTGTLRIYWKTTVRSMESGTSVYVTNSVKQGQAVASTDGTIVSRQGWLAHPRTAIVSQSGCGGYAFVVTEPAASYTVSISGEPSQIEISQEIRYIPSMLDGRLRLSLNCIAPGDINDSGDVRPGDYDLLVSLVGVDIESDEVGQYHPLADIDGDGFIDEDDVDEFLSMYCLGDFNDDGIVDVLDLLDFLDAYGNEHDSADMNEDGIIDILDYLLFVDWYGAGC